MKPYDKPECAECPAKRAYLARLATTRRYQQRNRADLTEYMREYRKKIIKHKKN